MKDPEQVAQRRIFIWHGVQDGLHSHRDIASGYGVSEAAIRKTQSNSTVALQRYNFGVVVQRYQREQQSWKEVLSGLHHTDRRLTRLKVTARTGAEK